MLSKLSSTWTVFEEKVLVVAGDGWGSSVEQCCCCCEGLMKVGRGGNWFPCGGRWRGELEDKSRRSRGRRVREQGRSWSLTLCSEGGCHPEKAQSWVLHLGVKNGELWDAEFSSKSILKSAMNDFICGSQHLDWTHRWSQKSYSKNV